jgi:hypothetical protein
MSYSRVSADEEVRTTLFLGLHPSYKYAQAPRVFHSQNTLLNRLTTSSFKLTATSQSTMRFALGTTALAALFSGSLAAVCTSESTSFTVYYEITAPGVPEYVAPPLHYMTSTLSTLFSSF